MSCWINIDYVSSNKKDITDTSANIKISASQQLKINRQIVSKIIKILLAMYY